MVMNGRINFADDSRWITNADKAKQNLPKLKLH